MHAGHSYGYDGNGNLSSDGTNTYVYDAENRLVSMGLPGQAPTVTLTYDPLGRLWQQATASTNLRFYYDGDQLVEERDGSGALLKRYAHAPGEDIPVVEVEGTGMTNDVFRNLMADERGSIVAVTDFAGNLVNINTYDEWGVPGSANQGRFQYTGQVWLPALQLYYYKARMYSSRLGRFLQTDPVGYKDQLNLYAYVGNDPIDGRDPDGQQAQAVASVACAGPQAAGCAVVIGAATCVASSACRHGANLFMHSRLGAAMLCAAGNCTYMAQRLLKEAQAPPANNGEGRPHGSPGHDAEVDRHVQGMKDKGYTDIRKNQAQVDAQGNKVGNNRPDVQGTNPETGQREHVEVDRDPRRGQQHQDEILRNYPQSKCTLVSCPK